MAINMSRQSTKLRQVMLAACAVSAATVSGGFAAEPASAPVAAAKK